jgi:hypothetical protein
MAVIAIIPTYLYLIFKPQSMSYMLLAEEADGRQGLKLGPGITLIFTIFVMIGFGYLFSDVSADTLESGRGGLRSAVSEGNVWRSVFLSLPLFFGALIVGVLFHISHRIIRKTSNLTQAVGMGLYMISTTLLFILSLGVVFEQYGTEGFAANNYVYVSLLSYLSVLCWQMFNFSHHAFANSKRAAVLVTMICLALIASSLVGLTIIVKALS